MPHKFSQNWLNVQKTSVADTKYRSQKENEIKRNEIKSGKVYYLPEFLNILFTILRLY